MLALARARLIRTLDRHPGLKRLAERVWRWQWQTRLRLRSAADGLDWDRMLRVDPRRIRWALTDEMPVYDQKGRTPAGDWDRPPHVHPFEDKDVFRAFAAHFDAGTPWEQTEFYGRVVRQIQSGDFRWECRSEAEFRNRLAGLEQLYARIRDEGFRPRCELDDHRPGELRRHEDEVAVAIGRDGELIFNNGRHRLCIAKLLGLTEIPVRVTVRHAAWMKFRRELLTFARSQPDGKLYQPLTHPDLADIPSSWSEQRLELIRPHLPAGGTVLDLGANWGFFCHALEAEGFCCTAVENAANALYFLERLQRIEQRTFRIEPVSILDYEFTQDFDVVLALSILHHFLKEEAAHAGLVRFLERMRARAMILQAHRPDEPQMHSAYRNYPPAEFAEFVARHGRFDQVTCIGEDRGRPLYRLSRS